MIDHITIAEARALGQRRGLDGVVAVWILPDGRVGFTSWGRTRRLCAALGRWIESEDAVDTAESITSAVEGRK